MNTNKNKLTVQDMNFEDSFATHSIALCSCGGYNQKLCVSCLTYLILTQNNREDFEFPSSSAEQLYYGNNMRTLKRNSPSRIVVPNVVYLMNLPQLSVTEDILKSPRFLGQYGRIERIIVHKNCTAHVTFVTATAAQLCIQSLHNFYFCGSKISAKVGTTKYPQDVDLAKISANNKSEPPPSICLDPIFPPPLIGSYKVRNELKYRNEIDTMSSNASLEFDNNLESVPISYGKYKDAKKVESLISPLESLRSSDIAQVKVLNASNLVFGTGGIHNSIWTDNSPRKSYQQLSQDYNQQQSSFVPNYEKSPLHLTEIDTKSSPRASSSYTYQSSRLLPTPSPSSSFSAKAVIKSNPLEIAKEKKFQSPRGIDELEQHLEGMTVCCEREIHNPPKQQVMESRLFTTYLPSCSPSATSQSKQDYNAQGVASFSRNDFQFQRNTRL